MQIGKSKPRFFQEEPLPANASLVGLAALVHEFGVKVPIRKPAAVSERYLQGSARTEGPWRLFDRRYDPGLTVGGHLSFALRHEDIDLLALKRLFEVLPPPALEEFIRRTPTGTTARQAWFLYEFLLHRELDVPQPPRVTAVPVLAPGRYVTVPGELSARHRVVNNVLGTPEFCPVVRRTAALEGAIARDLAASAQRVVGHVSPGLIARAASVLLMADSKASFEIEGERPPRDRLERWGRAVLQAGKRPLTIEEIERLHAVVIGDNRFVKTGVRTEGVFLGDRMPDGTPLPEFIGARPEDLHALLAGLLATNDRMTRYGVDPVVQAASLAFGFVYVHPVEDGNGRLHRYLIHHVLAQRRFSPPGLVFPVSSVLLDRSGDYQRVLQDHSGPLLPFIEWQPTDRQNVVVTNDTADLYRYFDCTEEAEFLYSCVERTIEEDLPGELEFLRRKDAALGRIMNAVEMPDNLASSFIMFVRQNDGQLPKKRRTGEFFKLTDTEVAKLEAIVNEEFAGFSNSRERYSGQRG